MPKAFILAGEASGDRIGAALTRGLMEREPGIEFIGVGGEAMEALGFSSLFPMDDLSVMGYRDVVLRLPLLLWRARQVIRTVLRTSPDVVVLIDSQVFSKVVAKGLRRRGYGGRIVLYVAPAVWAWGAERAAKLAALYDEVLSVLPFEPKTMAELGGPRTAYVGHPATEQYPMRSTAPEKGPLVLLPGSRRGEIRRHMPMFSDVAARAYAHPAVDSLVILSTRGQAQFIRSMVQGWPVAVDVITDSSERGAILEKAVAAIAVSGTVTLELALAGVPQVLTYVAEPAQVHMFRKATTRFIGLPNIIASNAIIPEMLFANRGEPDRLLEIVMALLDDPDMRAEQVRNFRIIRKLMEKGAPEAPLFDPVERVLAHLKRD